MSRGTGGTRSRDNDQLRCQKCGTLEPPWPYRWRFHDNGGALCPACAGGQLDDWDS